MRITNELKAIIMSQIKKKRDAEVEELYDKYREKISAINGEVFNSKEYAVLEEAYKDFISRIEADIKDEKFIDICSRVPKSLEELFTRGSYDKTPIICEISYKLQSSLPSVEDQLNRILVKLSYAPDFDGLYEELKALGIEL